MNGPSGRAARAALFSLATLAAQATGLGALGCGSSAGATGGAPEADAGGAGHGHDAGGNERESSTLKGNDGGGGGSSAGDAQADGGFCSQTGPVVELPGSQGSYSECTAQLASTLFTNALCTCDNAQVAGYLHTSSFSSIGATSPTGAAVGIDNDYKISAGYTEIGGSLSIAGSDSVAFFGYLQADGDMRIAGSANVPGDTQIARNGWLGGRFTDLGPASFGGDLHHASSVVAIPLSVTGANTMCAVSVPPPCPCGASDLLDVPAIVGAAMTKNDNAAVGLSPTQWTKVIVDTTFTLPCGSYYLDSIDILGSLTLDVTGRVALFVGGDIAVGGNLQVKLGSTAQIDIFIQDDLDLVGLAVFGDKSRPAATRIYVGGSGNVTLVGAGEFVGNLYAPRSQVTAPGYLDVYGSVFANDFQIPGYADFSYDSAITAVGQSCAPVVPPGGCTQCGGCTNGQACVQGKCGECTQDSDCCGQLACLHGACEPLLVLK